MVVVDKIEVLVLLLFTWKMLVQVVAPQKTCLLRVLIATARLQSLYVGVGLNNLRIKRLCIFGSLFTFLFFLFFL